MTKEQERLQALRVYKRTSKSIAKQLYYNRIDKDVYRKIDAAKTESEVTRVMITCRKQLRSI